ncbi:hypothetical protein VT50_0216830 [Streptomyces antioxidans]|uniref:Uncharacterized protein n=1 Tax=Streptomyces antioxidans TaxID=1507734 RepID=A0A1V4D504_9ACTN|nr:hypothetical protein [Streptomyces antioxidans]OPF79343.1 hypothetical protein VT50_0216830 [Streptomyces antioxidans]
MFQTIREVRASPFFNVMYEEIGPGGPGKDPTAIFELHAEEGFPLSERLKEAYFPYRYMALHWCAADIDVPLFGEFNIMNIDASREEMLQVQDFAWEKCDEELLSELSILDDISRGGGGQLATMRFLRGVSSPEIWFLDRFRTYVKLDLDYRDYLDVLIITKGATGWQYLFADVPLGAREYGSTLESLRLMLKILPEHFPGYDYEPLAARLEARL